MRADIDRNVSDALKKFLEELKHTAPQEAEAEQHWRNADLSFNYWQVQKDMAAILQAPGSLIKVLNCARRIRKTSTALSEAIQLGLKKRRAKIRTVAPTQKMLRKIVHPIVQKITEAAPADLKPVWKQQDGLYFLPSLESEVHVAGANNGHEDDSRGTEADLCIVDEAQMITNLRYLVNDVLMPQLITTGGQLWIILTPPKTPVHECLEFVIEARAKKAYAEFNIYRSEYPQDVLDKFCEEAGGPESTTWKREYLCQFVVDTNFSLVPEWRDNMIGKYEPGEFDKFYERYEGMDIGARHNTVNLYSTYDFLQAKLFIQGETVMTGPEMTTVKLAAEVKAKEEALWKGEDGKVRQPRSRVADNSNLILLQDLGALHGLHFGPTNKDTLEAMVNNVRLWVGAGKIVVDPSCEQLIGCLKYGVWDDKRKDFETSKLYGHFDAFAALMYLLRYIDVATNPIPANYGYDRASQHVTISKNTLPSGDAAALAAALGVLRRKR